MAKIKFFYWISRKIYNKFKRWRNKMLFETTEFGLKGKHCQVYQPSIITQPKNVFLHDYSRINADNIILNNKGKFEIGKYSVVSTGLRVVTDQHTSTVGIPHCSLGASHIHDKVIDVILDEDVWIGLNVVLLGGCHIQRGCIIGANTLINRHTVTPPYAVITGTPAHIIAVKFSIEQILKHEEKLYPPEKRFTKKELEELFKTYFEGKRVFGVDGNLTEEEKNILNETNKRIGFQYPTFK